MANVLAVQHLEDGPHNGVFKIDLTVDTSDVSSTAVWDPAAQSNSQPPDVATTGCYIEKIIYTVGAGLSVQLLWDASTPKSILHLTGSDTFDPGIGLKNNATSPTGKINIVTKGWASSLVLSATLIVYIVKTVL